MSSWNCRALSESHSIQSKAIPSHTLSVVVLIASVVDVTVPLLMQEQHRVFSTGSPIPDASGCPHVDLADHMANRRSSISHDAWMERPPACSFFDHSSQFAIRERSACRVDHQSLDQFVMLLRLQKGMGERDGRLLSSQTA
jgi:hypothetical protein